MVIVVFDAPAHREKVGAIVEGYRARFGQHGVFRSSSPSAPAGSAVHGTAEAR